MAVQWKFKNTSGGNIPADLENRIQTLETDNTTNKTNIATNTTNITTLDGNVVKLSGNQSKGGQLIFTSTGTPIELKPNSDTATFIAGYQSSNRRLWYLGKGVSSNDNLVIGTDRGNIMLQAANVIHCNNKKITNMADPTANTDAATKQYVDTIKTQIKEKVAASTDFADFKTKISQW